jgi:outer membrane protein insertion porin family
MPFFEQYFLGGSETVRGYLDNRFWGDKQFLMSVEYRHPIAKAIQGVLFVDVGDAWGSPYADQSSEDFAQDTSFAAHVGYGLGVRVQTPIGPIRIDYGMGEDGSRTHFSIGHPF